MNIKRFLTVLFIMLFLMCFGFANGSHNGCYAIRCYKCNKSNVSYGCTSCHAWRMFGKECEKNGHKCMVYHCQHGHTLYVSVDSDDEW